jgi:cytochrome P450
MTEHLDKTQVVHYLMNLDTEVKYLAAVLLVTVLVAWNWISKRDPRRAKLPPHVRGWPIINQTRILQQDDPTQLLIGWAQKYGELFRTTSAATEFIWINSRQAFKELIDRKSAIYSSRHPMPMTSDVVSAGRRMLFMPYGKEWRAYRGIIHKVPYPF